VTLLEDGRPLVLDTEDRPGRGPWARLLAGAVVPDEGSAVAERGRALARAGAVHSVRVAAGELSGRVGGERAAIAAQPVRQGVWTALVRFARGTQRLEEALAGRAQSVHLEHLMTVDWDEPLVPRGSALLATCSCGEPGCAHVAALAFAFADAVDRDPGLLLRWRGRDGADPDAEPDEPRVEPHGDPWTAPAELPELGPPRPLPQGAVLKRLGPSGLRVGGEALEDALARAYAAFARTRAG
jgi:hypothetical protein